MENSNPQNWYPGDVLEHGVVKQCSVSNCTISYRYFPNDNARGHICFIHGSGAHGHWWDHIIPFFAEGFSIIVPDLSGMGQSGHRESYSVEQFAEEIFEIHKKENLKENAVLVGHSLGGFVALNAGHNHPELFKGIVLLDSPVGPPEKDWEFNRDKSPIKPKKSYPSREEALERFRLIPPQPCDEKGILAYIADYSVMDYQNGYSWKYDDKLFTHFDMGNNPRKFADNVSRISLIYGGKSDIVSGRIKEYMVEFLLRNNRPVICQENSYHHVLIDSPKECVENIRLLLQEWFA